MIIEMYGDVEGNVFLKVNERHFFKFELRSWET